MANKNKKAMKKRGERPARDERDDEVVGRPVGEMDAPEDTERDDERPRRTRKKS